MLKWFSIRGILAEVRRIRWSSPKQLAKDSGVVLLFTVAFAIAFVIFTIFNAWILNNLLGI